MIDYFIVLRSPLKIEPLFICCYGDYEKECFNAFKKVRSIVKNGAYGKGYFNLLIIKCYNGEYGKKQIIKNANVKSKEF